MAALSYLLLGIFLWLLHRWFERKAKKTRELAILADKSFCEVRAGRAALKGASYEAIHYAERNFGKALDIRDTAVALSDRWNAREARLGSVRNWLRTTCFAKAVSYLAGFLDFTGVSLWLVERSLGVGPSSVGAWAIDHIRDTVGF